MRLLTIFTTCLLASCSTEGPDATAILDAKYEVSQTNDTQISLKAQFEKTGWNGGAVADLDNHDRVYVGEAIAVSDLVSEQAAFESHLLLEDSLVTLTRRDYPSNKPPFWSTIKDDRALFETNTPHDPQWLLFSFALLRKYDRSADRSFVTLPSAFIVLAPNEASTFSRGNDDLLIEWTTSEDEIDELYVRVRVDCGFNNTEEYNASSNTDDGYLIVPAGTLSQNINLEGECATEVTVIKRNEGTIDPAFAEGYITAVQVRTVNITSTD